MLPPWIYLEAAGALSWPPLRWIKEARAYLVDILEHCCGDVMSRPVFLDEVWFDRKDLKNWVHVLSSDQLVNEKCSQETMGVHLFRLHLSRDALRCLVIGNLFVHKYRLHPFANPPIEKRTQDPLT